MKTSRVLQDKTGDSLLTCLLTPWSRVLLEKLTGFATNHEILRILWNPKVHYRTHKRPTLIFIIFKPKLESTDRCHESPAYIGNIR